MAVRRIPCAFAALWFCVKELFLEASLEALSPEVMENIPESISLPLLVEVSCSRGNEGLEAKKMK